MGAMASTPGSLACWCPGNAAEFFSTCIAPTVPPTLISLVSHQSLAKGNRINVIGAIGVLAGMDVLLADLGEGLMIRRLGARNLARPARRPGYLTAMFFLIARSLVFGIA
ncbi:hypothetical protein, partial [Mesorhizobium sp.]